jgi:hypothetical protein
MKVVAAYSRITDMIFQPGQRFGEIKPTPIPDTEDLATAHLKAAEEIQQLVMEGQIDSEMVDIEELVEARADELRSEAVKDAEKRADRMNKVIDDQFAECGAERKLKLSIAEMVVLGDGCIKGATINVKGERKWQQGQEGWALAYSEKVYPDVQFRSVFNIYPDPFATDIDDMHGLFDRHVMTRSDFKKLSSFDGFDGDKIETIMVSSPQGNFTELHHETSRREISGMSNGTNTSQRYEVLEYWGMVSGSDLIAAGVEVDDEVNDYQANVWICAGQVI